MDLVNYSCKKYSHFQANLTFVRRFVLRLCDAALKSHRRNESLFLIIPRLINPVENIERDGKYIGV